MGTINTYDYAIIRVVPRVERGEFVNVGVILTCSKLDFLKARLLIDEKKIRALAPGVDLESIRATLEAIPKICAGGPEAGSLGRLSRPERFNWLIAPRSSAVQTSPVHTGRCADAQAALDAIFAKMVTG